MSELAPFLAGLVVFLLVLLVLGVLADSWEARDARRRNPYPRRTRDGVRRIR
jgi:hypothetical protein